MLTINKSFIINCLLLITASISAQPVIYKDAQTLITGTWAGAGNGGTFTFSEITGENPHEGSNHYKFTYSYTSWWAGVGLNMDNWGNNPARDLSGYSHIRIAYRGLSGNQNFSIKLRNGSNFSNTVQIGPSVSSYTVVDIPIVALVSGSNVNANAVREIDLDLGGVQTGSGTVYFDAIEMVNTGGSSASPETWARANSLGTGVNTSNWLEAYWLIPFGTYPELNKYTRAKVRALNTAGFQTFRLPIIVERLAETSPPYTIDFAHTAFKLVDSMILWADLYDFKLIIDNHHGYSLTNSNFSSEIPRLRAIWGQMIDRYDYLDPEQFFFEVYNEPTPDISNANWRTVAAAVLDEIRDHESQTHSVFVGANSWNSGSSLVSFTPLDDPDIIYTFHCYDPYLFTHQGMSWTSPPNLPARSFPLAGEVAAINALMASVDDWSTEYDVPANLGEFGCSTSADATSRCNWVQTMADAFNPYAFSNFYWDAITPSDAFGFFNDGIIDQAHVIPCFKDALGLYSTPAPVELTHFDIICQQENAVLHWSSYTLGKGYVFGIESSMDGKKWSTIKTIPAVEGQQNYQFEDTQSGQLYRLSMLAPNGHQHYSGIRNSTCREAFASVRVFPNPAVNQAILEVQQSDVSLAEVTLSDLAGRILWQVNIGSNDEIRQLSLPVSALPAGKYLLSGRTTDGILWHTPVTVTK